MSPAGTPPHTKSCAILLAISRRLVIAVGEPIAINTCLRLPVQFRRWRRGCVAARCRRRRRGRREDLEINPNWTGLSQRWRRGSSEHPTEARCSVVRLGGRPEARGHCPPPSPTALPHISLRQCHPPPSCPKERKSKSVEEGEALEARRHTSSDGELQDGPR